MDTFNVEEFNSESPNGGEQEECASPMKPPRRRANLNKIPENIHYEFGSPYKKSTTVGVDQDAYAFGLKPTYELSDENDPEFEPTGTGGFELKLKGPPEFGSPERFKKDLIVDNISDKKSIEEEMEQKDGDDEIKQETVSFSDL